MSLQTWNPIAFLSSIWSAKSLGWNASGATHLTTTNELGHLHLSRLCLDASQIYSQALDRKDCPDELLGLRAFSSETTDANGPTIKVAIALALMLQAQHHYTRSRGLI